ncbi:HDIG domain-containing protein [Candidatus Bipolaricaulota bacterium]|jgi:putative nucleotidyltransferase with HDIG domain|nr:HDIG domain-containing protein [Candidatus Bipolaricaulota bacterium]TFH09373.1 MAG: HDIG domain-containing protein [Candidatus Atribacteria bacterium]
MHIPTREEAFALLTEYNQSDRLINHALTVEAVMRYMARKRGEDEDKWGVIGLAHDLDYERYPQEHCLKTERILREQDWPEEYIHAIVSHGWGICTDIEPVHEMEKVLFAIDELTGLVTACALVRPSKSLHDLTVKSVQKKWKDKAFAAGADRDIIQKGIDMLGLERAELIADVIEGMKEAASELGLDGSLA